jgi:Protein-arginine deiminase (PAD)
VPAKSKLGFKLLLASPELGVSIFDKNPTSRILTGKNYVQSISAEMSCADPFKKGIGWPYVPTAQDLADYAGYPDDLKVLVGKSSYQMSGKQIRKYNLECQSKIDAAEALFTAELGLTKNDIAYVPSIYIHPVLKAAGADALTAGMVNMLVLGNECISPKPFGPMSRTSDLFEDRYKEVLVECGLNVTFVDDWSTYHLLKGEVHCGTNTLRKVDPAKKCWEVKL